MRYPRLKPDKTSTFMHVYNRTAGSSAEFPFQDAEKEEFIRKLKKLTEFYESLCRENDYGLLFTTCKQEGLAKIHERNGFERCDEGMIHLAKILD